MARQAKAKKGNASAEDIARWRDDPVAFALEVFGIEAWEAPRATGRSSQSAVLRDVARVHRVSCRSGHKIGKSTSAAILSYWWAFTRPGGRVILTAPSFTQVKKILWREIRRLGRIARERGFDIPEIPINPATGINWEDGREIVGLSTNTPERLGGFSGGHQLLIIDEASGYPDEFFHALLGNTAGGELDDPNAEAKIVKFGNPTQTSGHFYDDFRKGRGHVSCHHVSSEDTPNVRAGRAIVPGLATQHYLDELLKECNGDREHPLYMVRARGDFPQQGDNAVVPIALVETANANWRASGGADWPTPAKGCLMVGVDVAGFGDDHSVVAARHGRHFYPLVAASKFDEEAVAGLVLATCRELHITGEPRPIVKVDKCGIGLGVISILRQARDANGDPPVRVVPVDAAEKPNDEERFLNRRSELWFSMVEWLKEPGAELPDDDRLAAELVAPTYSFDNQGRQVVEKKRDFKRRLGRSPDRADAVALSIYSPIAERSNTRPSVAKSRNRWANAPRRGFG